MSTSLDYYTPAEAQALLGTEWRNTAPYAGVPVGSRGRVVGHYASRGRGLTVEWLDGPAKGVRDGFTKRDMEVRPGANPWPAMVPEADWPAVEAEMKEHDRALAELEAEAAKTDAWEQAQAEGAELSEREARQEAEARDEGEHE